MAELAEGMRPGFMLLLPYCNIIAAEQSQQHRREMAPKQRDINILLRSILSLMGIRLSGSRRRKDRKIQYRRRNGNRADQECVGPAYDAPGGCAGAEA
jgi:hypothetical protein